VSEGGTLTQQVGLPGHLGQGSGAHPGGKGSRPGGEILAAGRE
jgi:hypothetical protein